MNRRFDGFGAGRVEERPRTRHRRNLTKQVGKLEHGLVREGEPVGKRHLVGLALECLDQPWMAVADAHHHRATAGVDKFAAICGPDATPLGAHGDGELAPRSGGQREVRGRSHRAHSVPYLEPATTERLHARHDAQVGMRIRDVRWPVLIGVFAVALMSAACGGSGGATSTADATVDPLTITVPPSPIDASLPVEPGIFRVVGRPSTTLGLLRVAGMQGLLGQQGLSARITEVATSSTVSSELQDGTVDAAVVASDEAVRLASSGVPIRIVMLLTAGTSSHAILARADVADIPGLAGQDVAVSQGSEGELLVQGALAADNIPRSTVRVVPANSLDPGLMLVRGEVAAAAVTATQAEAAIAADPTLHVLYTAGDYPGLISHVLVVRQDVAAQRPGQILAFVRGWQALYAFDRDQQDIVIADVAGVTDTDLTTAAVDLAGLSLYDLAANAVELLPGGEYFDQTIGVVVAAAQAAGWITDPIDGQQLIDGSFVQAVASAR